MHDEQPTADENAVGGGEVAGAASTEKALDTVALCADHRVGEFRCSKSDRVQEFLRSDPQALAKNNYCKVFVFRNPEDLGKVWGYYTLSAATVARSIAGSSLQKKLPGGLPIPVIRIGFMGRDDGAPRGLGAALIIDAATRVSRIADIGIWGITLDAENDDLANKFYAKVGFKRAKPAQTGDPAPLLMYGPLSAFIPGHTP